MGNRMLVIGPGELTQTIHRIVEENNDENMKALNRNIGKAARHARDELKRSPGHNSGGNSDRGTRSISGGYGNHASTIGMYDKGWFVYGRLRKKYLISRVVANKHAPKLTHLLEFGHSAGGGNGKDPRFLGREGTWIHMARIGTRTSGDGAIARAYRNAAPIARGGM